MTLLPGWKERIEQAQRAPYGQEPLSLRYPRSPEYYARRTTFIATPDQVDNLLALARQRPIIHAAFDFEFAYDRPGIPMGRGSYAEDPRSIRPLLVSCAFVEMDSPDRGVLYPFVVDVRSPEVCARLKPVFRLPIPFVAHFAKAELFCLWQLGLTEPAMGALGDC